MFEQEVINNLTEGVSREPKLYFVEGRLFQAEQVGATARRFVDVTEEVATAISEYIK